MPLLTLIDRGVLPADIKGAWAGEIGQTQILPSDYLTQRRRWRRRRQGRPARQRADVIMTTGNKIQSRGWKRDQPWIVEIRVPDTLPWDQTGRTNKLPLAQWSEWGVTNRDGSPLTDNGLNAGVVLPMGARGRPSSPTTITTSISNGTSRSPTR